MAQDSFGQLDLKARVSLQLIALELPRTIITNEREQMLQICQKITSFTTLLEFGDYFKYFANRGFRVSTIIDNLHGKIFAHPSCNPTLVFSMEFLQLLKDIKLRMPNTIEYNTINQLELKHYRRFWKSRSNIRGVGKLGNSYFFQMQIERTKGLNNAFEIAFDSVPLITFPQNISIYSSKQDLIEIGNCIEVGESDQSHCPTDLCFQQQMNCTFIPNASRPWYLFVNEANIGGYDEVLSYILANACLGTTRRDW